jgi:hypothetical protein
LSTALLPFLILAGWRWSAFGDIGRLAGVVACALVVNAFVCGALANPHDRYGARLVWLALFTFALAVLRVGLRARVPAPSASTRPAPGLARLHEV